MRSRDDRPEELATMAETLAEEDDPEDSMMTTEVLVEEAYKMTRPSERL